MEPCDDLVAGLRRFPCRRRRRRRDRSTTATPASGPLAGAVLGPGPQAPAPVAPRRGPRPPLHRRPLRAQLERRAASRGPRPRDEVGGAVPALVRWFSGQRRPTAPTHLLLPAGSLRSRLFG